MLEALLSPAVASTALEFLIHGAVVVLAFVVFVGAGLVLETEFPFWFILQPFLPRDETNPFVATAATLALGALLGGLTVLVAPHRVIPFTVFPGSSLLIGAVAGAATMQAAGTVSELRGRPALFVATWWAGGLLAFSFALTRFLVVGGT